MNYAVPQPINPHEGLKPIIHVPEGIESTVPQPINPHEGLKLFDHRLQSQFSEQSGSTANQPARGIETRR